MLNIGGFKIDAVVLCEQNRVEINQKIILLGVFSGDIVVAEMPATLQISAYVQFSTSPMGEFKIDFKFVGPDGVEAMVSAEATMAAIGPSAVPLPTVPLMCRKDGTVSLLMRVNGEDWHEILKRKVFLGNVPGNTSAPTAAVQTH
jgi:hypothetical protein